MANHYYEMNGTLKLQAVTPIIQVFFGSRELDAKYPGNGEAYIAEIPEHTDTSWDTVIESLQEYCQDNKIELEEDSSPQEILSALAKAFEVDLQEEIESIDFDYTADLDDLVSLAKKLNDGHGLTGYSITGAWTCSKPRLGEFGGEGIYRGKHISVATGSSKAEALGAAIEDILERSDNNIKVSAAAEVFQKYLSSLINGVQDPELREQIFCNLGFKL